MVKCTHRTCSLMYIVSECAYTMWPCIKQILCRPLLSVHTRVFTVDVVSFSGTILLCCSIEDPMQCKHYITVSNQCTRRLQYLVVLYRPIVTTIYRPHMIQCPCGDQENQYSCSLLNKYNSSPCRRTQDAKFAIGMEGGRNVHLYLQNNT